MTVRSRDKYIDAVIGNNIKMIRSAKGLSQGDVAAILGVSFQQIQKYERGTNRVSASTLYVLSRSLNVPILNFFGELDTDSLPMPREIQSIVDNLLELNDAKLQKDICQMVNTLCKSVASAH